MIKLTLNAKGYTVRIANRLILHTILIIFSSVILTSAIVGLLSYQMGKKIIEQEATQKLVSIRESKKEEIERYFDTIHNQIVTFASDLMLIDAMNDFKNTYPYYKHEALQGKKSKFNPGKVRSYLDEFIDQYHKINGNDQSVSTRNLLNFNNESSFLLQYNYIIENPYPLGKKYLLDSVEDGTRYSAVHKKYHPVIREYLQKFGYYDIFLIDAETSEVVYTVYKEVDFASTLSDGVSDNTGLDRVFKAANAADAGKVFIADFASYKASYNEQAAFIATPIYKDNVKIGILVFQFPVDVINNIMTYNKRWEDVGLGYSGETYLVGKDYLLRSTSRFFITEPEKYLQLMKNIGLPQTTIDMMKDKKTTVGLQPVKTKGTTEVFNQDKPGFDIFPDYRNIPVLSAYTPLQIAGLDWALMSEMDVTEAYNTTHSFALQMLLITILVAFIGIFIAVFIGAKLNSFISHPIIRLNNKIRRIAKNMDLTTKINIETEDEIGEMANSVNQLIETFRKALQETLKSTEKVRNTGQELQSLTSAEDLSHEAHAEKIIQAEKDLYALTEKLQSLSSQFKIIKEKTQEEEDW